MGEEREARRAGRGARRDYKGDRTRLVWAGGLVGAFGPFEGERSGGNRREAGWIWRMEEACYAYSSLPAHSGATLPTPLDPGRIAKRRIGGDL